MESQSSKTEYPVSSLIKKRRSKRAYLDKPVEQGKINSLFEAARWAPSSMNEQPWSYLYATKDQKELWNKLLKYFNSRYARERMLILEFRLDFSKLYARLKNHKVLFKIVF